MISAAFVLSTPIALRSASSWTPSSTFSTKCSPLINSKSRQLSAPSRRVTYRMSAEEEIKTAKTEIDNDPSDDSNSEGGEGTGFQAPSFNTTAFSDFVESLQSKASELQERVENIDSDKLVADSIDSGKGLADNFLAGDWLNRGEVYGALQIVLVYLLFHQLTSIDALVSLITGPLLILLGSGISGKALWDLGLKNLSIWPSPVPNGCLKTDGVYQYVRHPIYSGLLTASVGYAVSSGSPAKMATAIAMAVLIVKKIDVEEDFLVEAYDDYEDYKESVPFKILPKVY